jgi:hypothetical protein
MGEIGSLKNRFKVYRKNIFLNKKKIKVKIKNYKEKNYKVNKIKKNSKVRNFFLIIIGFIFGFFEYKFSKKNISNNKSNSKKKIVSNNNFKKKDNQISLKNFKISNKVNIYTNVFEQETYSLKPIPNLRNDKKSDVDLVFISSNLLLNKSHDNKFSLKKQNKNILNNSLKKSNKNSDKKTVVILHKKGIGLQEVKPSNELEKDNQIKKQDNVELEKDHKLNKNDKLNIEKLNSLEEKKSTMIENISTLNSNKGKKIEKKEEVFIDSRELEKGISIIKKTLIEQEKFFDKEYKIFNQNSGNIKSKLKINSFDTFIDRTLEVIYNLFPVALFKNKMLGTLVSSILINNSIKKIRKQTELNKNINVIVPEYLNQIKKQGQIIESIFDVQEDSLNNLISLKVSFEINNHMYAGTDEYKKVLDKLNIVERKLKIDLEKTKDLINKKDSLEKVSKQKIYKLSKNVK